jgi:hypothetical protein
VGDVQGARKAMAESLAKATDHWRAYSQQDNPLLRKIELGSVRTRPKTRSKHAKGAGREVGRPEKEAANKFRYVSFGL